MAVEQTKTQRLFDLVAALLRHHRSGITQAELNDKVPGYWGDDKNPKSVSMMFERDKAELNALGIKISPEGVKKTGTSTRYRLDPKSFFLPDLELADAPERAPSGGLRGVAPKQRRFSSEELVSMARAADVLAQLGDSALAEQAHSGLRRLAHDLPVERLSQPTSIVRGETGLDEKVFESLADAVLRRKRVSFLYHALEQPVAAERQAQPYGLANIEGRWSLFAFDEAARAMRQFRLRRLSNLKVNTKNPSTADFQVPAEFDLWALTRHRHDWELGASAPETLTVRFLQETGLTALAREYGSESPEHPKARNYAVRRREPFLRWVLSFAGEASVIAPADAAREFAALVQEVSALHQAEAAQ